MNSVCGIVEMGKECPIIPLAYVRCTHPISSANVLYTTKTSISDRIQTVSALILEQFPGAYRIICSYRKLTNKGSFVKLKDFFCLKIDLGNGKKNWSSINKTIIILHNVFFKWIGVPTNILHVKYNVYDNILL